MRNIEGSTLSDLGGDVGAIRRSRSRELGRTLARVAEDVSR